MSWADRIAYCAHDFEDAVQAGVISADDLPAEVADVCGRTRREQLGAFISAVVTCLTEQGMVGMAEAPADALARLRTFNYERIYLAAGVDRPVRGRRRRCSARWSSTSPATRTRCRTSIAPPSGSRTRCGRP